MNRVHSRVSPSPERPVIVYLLVLTTSVWLAAEANAAPLVFNKLIADTYHAPTNRGGSLRIVTDGVVDTTTSFRGFDTFNANTGNPVFAGLIRTGLGAQPQVFDSVSVDLGNQFVDGGDFASAPNLYLLTTNTDTDRTLPSGDPANWTAVTGATATHVGFNYSFTLSGAASARTAYGFAIGGVPGSGSARFLSVSELSANGTTTLAPLGAPTSLVASVYHSPDNDRNACFNLAINGEVSPGGGFENARDFDTFEGVVGQTKTDFGGLVYASPQQFDTVTLSYGTRFSDGGRFPAAPRLFLNVTGVDTNTTLPESDLVNWREITTATLNRETDGETFDLTALPAIQRQGFGWAIGGINGDGNTSATPQNFISISELSASGIIVPEPSSSLLVALGSVACGLRRRTR
jgi:hypothetical protein